MDQAAGDSTTGAGQASPALARMMVGRRLGWHRAECGLSVDEAAGAAGLPAARVLAIEGGQARLKLREVGALCSLYEFSDVEEFADLLGLARSANGPEWWHPYRDVIPAWFTHYLSLEQAASLIRSYEPQVIPGLLPGLQIPDVVYLEQLTSGLYPGEAESTYYWHILNLLAI